MYTGNARTTRGSGFRIIAFIVVFTTGGTEMDRVALRIQGEGDHVIAYRDRAFLFTDANDEEDRATAAEAVEFLGLGEKLDPEDADAWSLREAVAEHLPEALTGYLDDDGYLVLSGGSDYRHGRGSRLLRSVLRELNLSGARTPNLSGDIGEEIPAREVTGRLPSSLLHGTCSAHMPGILRKGLSAGETRSNYEMQDIRHPDTVFLTENPVKAAYHADNACHQEGGRRGQPNRMRGYGLSQPASGFPVIVEFAIPDKAKLVPDYDIDVWSEAGEGSFEQTERSRERSRERGYDARSQEDPFKLSRKFGIFGYRGRIPAAFIKSIMLRPDDDPDEGGFSPAKWVAVTPEQLERAIEYGDPGAWEWEDTCPECGEVEEDCPCDRCEECGKREWECGCEEVALVSAYWRAFRIVAASEERVRKLTEPDERERHDVARTSVRQVPALHKKLEWADGSVNLDLGGGKFDTATEWLAERGVRNLVLDRYNRSPEHNKSVLDEMSDSGPDTVTVANVLNVIRDPEMRREVMETAAELVKPGGAVYFAVYEGDRSGKGRVTSKGSWQENRRLRTYLDEIRAVFPEAKIAKGHIVATA